MYIQTEYVLINMEIELIIQEAEHGTPCKAESNDVTEISMDDDDYIPDYRRLDYLSQNPQNVHSAPSSLSSILGQFGNAPPDGATREQMEEFIRTRSNVMDLELLRNRFANPMARPTLTKFVYALTRLLFTDDEIMAPLRDLDQQKIDWIYDESYRVFPGCTYSTVKNAVGQVGRTKRNRAKYSLAITAQTIPSSCPM